MTKCHNTNITENFSCYILTVGKAPRVAGPLAAVLGGSDADHGRAEELRHRAEVQVAQVVEQVRRSASVLALEESWWGAKKDLESGTWKSTRSLEEQCYESLLDKTEHQICS